MAASFAVTDRSPAARRTSALPVVVVLLLVCAMIGGLALRASAFGSGSSSESSVRPMPGAATASPAPLGRFVLYAEVERSAGQRPARFSASLPALESELDAELLWTPDRPSPSYARDAICSGDASMRERYLRGIELAARRTTLPRVIQTWGQLIWSCEEPEYCTWVRRISHYTHPFVRGNARYLLAGCAEDRDAPIFDHRDTPSIAVVRWHRTQRLDLQAERERAMQPPPPAITTAPPPRLVDAVIEIAAEPASYPDRLVLDDAFAALAEFQHPTTEATLLGIHRSTYDAIRRDQVAMALYASTGVEGQRVFRDACTLRADQRRPHVRCGVIDPNLAPPGALAVGELPRWRSLDPAVLHRCAEDASEPWEMRECLWQLGRVDRARAGAVARGLLDRRDLDTDTQAVATSLVQRRVPRDLQVRLAAAGVIPRDASSCDAIDLAHAVTGADVMIACHRAATIDTEAIEVPPEHDQLMRQLAALGRPALDGVEFETRSTGFAVPRPLRVIAYVNGMQIEARARDFSEVFDIETAVSFANALARELGREERWVIAESDPEMPLIVVGTEAALRRVSDEGLVALLPGGTWVTSAPDPDRYE